MQKPQRGRELCGLQRVGGGDRKVAPVDAGRRAGALPAGSC